MSVAELIKKFDVRETVPVDVNDVITEFKDRGIKDEIFFWAVDLNDHHLKGQLVHIEEWDHPGFEGAPTRTFADIYYAKDMPDDEKRLVACKELLHILDHPACRAATEEEVEKLFSKIGLPPEMQEPFKDGPAVNTDRTAIYQAVAVLFPYATRQLLLKPYNDGKINLADIIRMVDLPKKYVASVMHENWEGLHRVLTNGVL